MTVGQMLNQIDARELTEWEIFDQSHGLPDKRADIAAGAIAATMVNIQPRKKGVKRKPLGPADFFPWLKPQKVVNTSSGIPGPSLEHLNAVMLAAGGKPKVSPDEYDSEPGSNPRA